MGLGLLQVILVQVAWRGRSESGDACRGDEKVGIGDWLVLRLVLNPVFGRIILDLVVVCLLCSCRGGSLFVIELRTASSLFHVQCCL